MYVIGYGGGYLLNHISKSTRDRQWITLTNSIRRVKCELDGYNISEVWDFACPGGNFTASNFKDQIFKTLNDTRKLIKWCNNRGITLIYASSLGVEDCENINYFQKIYNTSKFLNEEMIKSYCKNYKILKIPRVYGSERFKGLIQNLRDETFTGNFEDKIEFIDIDDFVSQTLEKLKEDVTVFKYKTEIQSILTIKARYIDPPKTYNQCPIL